METHEAGIAAAVCFAVGILIGCCIGSAPIDGYEQRAHDEAVKAGHAEYYLDENHECCWRWLPAKGE